MCHDVWPRPSTRLTQAHFHEIGHLGRRSGLLEKVAEITGRLSARRVFQVRRLVENGHQRVTAGGKMREGSPCGFLFCAKSGQSPALSFCELYSGPPSRTK